MFGAVEGEKLTGDIVCNPSEAEELHVWLDARIASGIIPDTARLFPGVSAHPCGHLKKAWLGMPELMCRRRYLRTCGRSRPCAWAEDPCRVGDFVEDMWRDDAENRMPMMRGLIHSHTSHYEELTEAWSYMVQAALRDGFNPTRRFRGSPSTIAVYVGSVETCSWFCTVIWPPSCSMRLRK
jgi:hypothetical protein